MGVSLFWGRDAPSFMEGNMRTKKEYNAYKRHYRKEHPEYRSKERKRQAKELLERKKRVLTHYGKGKQLLCCWRKCEVEALDLLSIDHIENDGAEHRKALGYREHSAQNSTNFYRWLEQNSFPDGYQTLCYNHQWKKEILRRRAGKMSVKKSR